MGYSRVLLNFSILFYDTLVFHKNLDKRKGDTITSIFSLLISIGNCPCILEVHKLKILASIFASYISALTEFKMTSRLILVSGLKWVDEVIANAPYAITEEFMNTLFNKSNIDYVIHGDDPCLLPDGTDAYGLAKKAGRYKQIKCTEGVSSTDIVGLIL